jgi:hypothetical protein
MKRDWNLIREILLRFESMPNINLQNFLGKAKLTADEEDNDDMAYQIKLLLQTELLDYPKHTDENSPFIVGLSWKGHEFLDLIRDDSSWEDAKLISSDIGFQSYDSLVQILKDIFTYKLRHRMSDYFTEKLLESSDEGEENNEEG